MSMALAGSALVFFSVMAYLMFNSKSYIGSKFAAVLFMLAGGASMMVGLQWFEVYTTDLGLSISLMLIAYCFVCFGFAYSCIFKNEDEGGDYAG